MSWGVRVEAAIENGVDDVLGFSFSLSLEIFSATTRALSYDRNKWPLSSRRATLPLHERRGLAVGVRPALRGLEVASGEEYGAYPFPGFPFSSLLDFYLFPSHAIGLLGGRPQAPAPASGVANPPGPILHTLVWSHKGTRRLSFPPAPVKVTCARTSSNRAAVRACMCAGL